MQMTGTCVAPAIRTHSTAHPRTAGDAAAEQAVPTGDVLLSSRHFRPRTEHLTLNPPSGWASVWSQRALISAASGPVVIDARQHLDCILLLGEGNAIHNCARMAETTPRRSYTGLVSLPALRG